MGKKKKNKLLPQGLFIMVTEHIEKNMKGFNHILNCSIQIISSAWVGKR